MSSGAFKNLIKIVNLLFRGRLLRVIRWENRNFEVFQNLFNRQGKAACLAHLDTNLLSQQLNLAWTNTVLQRCFQPICFWGRSKICFFVSSLRKNVVLTVKKNFLAICWQPIWVNLEIISKGPILDTTLDECLMFNKTQLLNKKKENSFTV